LQAKGLAFIDDPTNADDRFTRNRIRHHLLPALDRVFASWRAPVARSAAHAAQAAALLDEYAALDLQQVGTPPRIEALQKLSAARQGNVLRWWLRQAHGVRPSTVQLQELLAQLADCTTRGHRIDIRVGTGWVLRDGPLLLYEPAGPQAKPHL
jgi:tRNA(Ile)-lysidine synthase